MKIEILSKQKNPIIQRENIKFSVKEVVSTPSRKDLQAKIAAMCNAKTEMVVIGKIENKFGMKEVLGEARIYESKQKMKEFEPKYSISKNFEEKKAKGEKKEEKPKTEKKEEATVEKKEEKKAEEKPKKEGGK